LAAATTWPPEACHRFSHSRLAVLITVRLQTTSSIAKALIQWAHRCASHVTSSVGTAFLIPYIVHGKWLLGASSEEFLQRLLADPLERRTPATLVGEAEVSG
jgi:hypothetical protein